MSRFPRSPSTRVLRVEGDFRLDGGAVLPGLELAYRTWGTLNAQADNAVVVCHALTGSADADDWWGALIGHGLALDPARDFIVCSNALGGCYGSTGPTSAAPDGAPWGGRFPAVTVRDQVRAQIALADALGIRGIRLVIGGSLGGLQALEWALLDPQRVQAVASIAASARQSAWGLAWSEAQRLALRADPAFADGHYAADAPPQAGLAAARAIAMATYRSAAGLEQRFGRQRAAAVFGARADVGDDYAVRAWLRHHADALTRRFDANAYLRLLGALDSHDLTRGRGDLTDALRTLRQPVLVVSIPSDALYLPTEQFALAEALPRAELSVLHSPHGHDGFLIDAARLEPRLRAFRARHAGEAPRLHAVPTLQRDRSLGDDARAVAS